MKKNLLKKSGVAVSVLLIAATLSFGLAFAQSSSKSSGGGRLEGSWNVRVTVRDCQSGDEIQSFDSLTTFMSGGTLIDSTTRFPQSLKTPGHGYWNHTTDRSYAFGFKNFNFDAAGNYTGYVIVRQEATMNSKATAYESEGTLGLYAPNGTLIISGCSTTTATRFE